MLRAPRHYTEPENDGVMELTLYIDKQTCCRSAPLSREPESRMKEILIGEYYFRDIELNPQFSEIKFKEAAVTPEVVSDTFLKSPLAMRNQFVRYLFCALFVPCGLASSLARPSTSRRIRRPSLHNDKLGTQRPLAFLETASSIMIATFMAT